MGSVSTDGRLIVSKATNYSGDFLSVSDLVMPKDDIGGGGIIGKVGYIDADETYVMGDHVYRLTANLGNPLFLSYVINAYRTNTALRKKVIGSAQLGLGRKSVDEQEMPFPPHDEQNAIASVLSDMDAEIAALETKLAKARQVKQGMMQELLTGRIRLVAVASKIISLPVKRELSTAPTKSHNWQINEAVIIAVLAKHFGTAKYPLARKRCTKLTYLLHRWIERTAEGYLKKAAGPYNPAIRYKGPETIAQKNGYILLHHNGAYEGFTAAENILEAETYFGKWYRQDVLKWLEQFRFKKTDELELLTTVDMAIEDLWREGQKIELDTVKQVIWNHPEWKAKLNREIFSDGNIIRAIQSCKQLFAKWSSEK